MIKRVLENGKRFFSKQETSIFSAAAAIALAMVGSALLGIWRDRLLYAKFFVVNPGQLDVYNAAFKLPDTLFQLLISGALSAAFIPIFSKWIDKDKKKANEIASIMLNWLLAVFIGLGLFIYLLARPLSQLITADFSFDQISLMTTLVRLLLAAQLFLLISNFLTGILHSHQRFILPALAPIIYNLGIIVGILFLSDRFGIFGPAIGVIIGAVGHFIIQIPLLKTLHFSFKPFYFKLSDPVIKKVIALMVPRNLALIVCEIEMMITVYWATGMGKGALSLFYLAQHLSQLPIRLVGATIGQATLPAFSHQRSRNGFNSFKNLLRKTFSQTVYLAFPVTVIFLILRIPLVRLAFGAKQFPWQATIVTGQVLAILSVTIFCQTISEILRRAFYAMNDTKTILAIDVVGMIVNLGLVFTGVIIHRSNLLWLAAGLSFSRAVKFFLLLWFLEKKLTVLIVTDTLVKGAKMILSAFMAALLTWLSMKAMDRFIFDTSYVIPLVFVTGISGLIGLVVYAGFSRLLRIEEFFQFFHLAQNFLRRSRRVKI